MPSPDFSEYIDLTVNDLQPPELYNAAVDYAREALPEFEPRAGSVEDALLQAFSFMNSSYVAAANRIPNGTIEGVLQLYGLVRREAGQGSVTAQFTILSPGGSVESGTTVIYLVEEDGEIMQYPFITTSTVNANTGLNTVIATLDSLVLGTLPVIPIGTPLVIAQPSSEILTCITTSAVVTGDISESDTEYLERGVTFLSSLTQSLCTSTQIEAYLLSTYPSVSRCKVYDLAFGASTNSSTSSNAVYDMDTSKVTFTLAADDPFVEFYNSYGFTTGAGYTTAWITTDAIRKTEDETYSGVSSGFISSLWTYNKTTRVIEATIDNIEGLDIANAGKVSLQIIGDLSFSVLETANSLRTRDARGSFIVFTWGIDDKPVPIDDKDSIYQDLLSKVPLGLNFFLMDAMPVQMDIYVQIEVDSGYVDSTVNVNVKSYLESYFSPTNYPLWTKYVYKNEIVAIASQVDGVSRVVEVDMEIMTYGSALSYLYRNQDMADALVPVGSTVAPFAEFLYSGSLPLVTFSVSTGVI